jgi:hypothetical protein
LRTLLTACLALAGCVAPPADEGVSAQPTVSDFARPAGSAASLPVGTVLSADPPMVRLSGPREQPEGVALVAREADLTPAALLRVVSRRGAIAQVAVVAGRLRPGLEVVEPSAALAAEASRLPAAP